MADEKVRSVFRFGPDVNDAIVRLATQTGSTKSEVVRKAVSLYDMAYRETHDKLGEVLLRDNSGTCRTVIIT